MKELLIFLTIVVLFIGCSYCSIIPEVIDIYGDPQCPYRDFISPNPKDCKSYYECKDGKRKAKKCYGDDRFDVRESKCVQDDDAECAQQKDWQGFECPAGPFGFYRNDKCDRYWICNQGVETLAYCEKGQKFDVKTKRCMSDWWARCKEIGGKPTTKPEEPTTEKPSSGDKTETPNKEPQTTTPEPTEPNLYDVFLY